MNPAALRPPWVTLGLVGTCLLIALLPGAAGALEYDRARVDSGEIWRMASGHLVHWTPRMALVDLAVVLIAGSSLEIRSRRMAVLTLVAGALIVGCGLHLLPPGWSSYRGASGIASALFVAAALATANDPARPWMRWLAAGLPVLYGLKILLEVRSGDVLAAGALPPGVGVAPGAHLLGGLAGLLAFGATLLVWREERTAPSRSPSFAAPRPWCR